jgi:hypothetical protein
VRRAVLASHHQPARRRPSHTRSQGKAGTEYLGKPLSEARALHRNARNQAVESVRYAGRTVNVGLDEARADRVDANALESTTRAAFQRGASNSRQPQLRIFADTTSTILGSDRRGVSNCGGCTPRARRLEQKSRNEGLKIAL